MVGSVTPTDTKQVVEFSCEPSYRDPWRCVTHDSAWDLSRRCQKALGLPEPRRVK